MTKPELGTKRLCAHCGAKFYDLQHEPITCPKCSAVFEAVQVKSRGRAEPVRTALREVAPLVPTTAQSLEYAHAEAQGKRNKAGEAETAVELDDEGDKGLDDDTLIEASDEEDTDFTGIIGDDVLKKEET